MKAIVNNRGQVTIPKALRDSLGITPHTVLEFREEKGCLIVEIAKKHDHISDVRGILKLKESTDELLAAMRGREYP